MLVRCSFKSLGFPWNEILSTVNRSLLLDIYPKIQENYSNPKLLFQPYLPPSVLGSHGLLLNSPYSWKIIQKVVLQHDFSNFLLEYKHDCKYTSCAFLHAVWENILLHLIRSMIIMYWKQDHFYPSLPCFIVESQSLSWKKIWQNIVWNQYNRSVQTKNVTQFLTQSAEHFT